jgi:hypothetical protein
MTDILEQIKVDSAAAKAAGIDASAVVLASIAGYTGAVSLDSQYDVNGMTAPDLSNGGVVTFKSWVDRRAELLAAGDDLSKQRAEQIPLGVACEPGLSKLDKNKPEQLEAYETIFTAISNASFGLGLPTREVIIYKLNPDITAPLRFIEVRRLPRPQYVAISNHLATAQDCIQSVLDYANSYQPPVSDSGAGVWVPSKQ